MTAGRRSHPVWRCFGASCNKVGKKVRYCACKSCGTSVTHLVCRAISHAEGCPGLHEMKLWEAHQSSAHAFRDEVQCRPSRCGHPGSGQVDHRPQHILSGGRCSTLCGQEAIPGAAALLARQSSMSCLKKIVHRGPKILKGSSLL